MRFDDNIASRIQVAKTFNEDSSMINCIDYTSDGATMITSCNDDSIVLYDLKTGTRDKAQVNSKKYGVGIIRFTHETTNAIHTSTKVDNTIRYLSLYDNKYIRYFIGHTKKVTCLTMSPLDDMFISASLDNTIRLWDLKNNSCQGLMQVQGRSVAAFDPEGLIFAAGINSECIKLYDLRSFDKGPFTTFKTEKERDVEWTGMEFSPDGKLIMLNTNSDVIKLVDSFTGTVKQSLRGHRNQFKLDLEATFTPDSQYIYAPSSDTRLHVYSAESGRLLAQKESGHSANFRICSFNPKHCMLATACNTLNFWIAPDDVQ